MLSTTSNHANIFLFDNKTTRKKILPDFLPDQNYNMHITIAFLADDTDLIIF